MEFNFNGHLYELTFEDKPVLKENGLLISNKTLSVLRKYINANSINILLFNRNGKPKNTYSIVRELLTYNSKLVSKRKKEMKSSFGLNHPKKIKLTKLKKKEVLDFGELNNKPKLLIIACSDSKVDGVAINNEQNYFSKISKS